MGWDLLEHASKDEAIDEIASGDNVLHKAVKYDAAWTVEKGCPHGDTWVICHYLEDSVRFALERGCDPSDTPKGWWWKPVTESEGPTSISCPLEFLDAATCPHCVDLAWRARVRDVNRMQRKAIPEGFCVSSAQDLAPGDLALAEDIFSWSNVWFEHYMVQRMHRDDGEDPLDFGLEGMSDDAVCELAKEMAAFDFDQGYVPTEGVVLVTEADRHGNVTFFDVVAPQGGPHSGVGGRTCIGIAKGSNLVRRARRKGLVPA